MLYFGFFSTQVLIIFGFIFIVFGVTGISVKWQQEWPTVPFSLRVQSRSDSQNFWVCVGWIMTMETSVLFYFSLQATGPFLQFGAVGAITLLSPFIFKGYHAARNKCMCKPKFNTNDTSFSSHKSHLESVLLNMVNCLWLGQIFCRVRWSWFW